MKKINNNTNNLNNDVTIFFNINYNIFSVLLFAY